MPRRTHISSILVTGAGLLFASAVEASEPRPDPERIKEAVVACGVPAAGVRIVYQDKLQSDVVIISDTGGSDEGRFRCLRKAVPPHYFVDLSTAPQWEAYLAFLGREDREFARAKAQRLLKSAGRRVPRFDPANGLAAFGRAVEAACSIREGSALETVGTSALTLTMSFLDLFADSKTHDQLDCLSQMVTASDADKYGVRLVLVGAEAQQMEIKP